MNVVDDLILGAFVAYANAGDDRRVISTNESNVATASCPAETKSVGLDRPDLSGGVGTYAKRANRIDVVANAKVKTGEVLTLRAAADEMAASSPPNRLQDRIRLGVRGQRNDE
jgi:hypothetical protein